MEFGLFNLMGYRDSGRTTRDIMRETVEQVRLADAGGFASAWFAEHHFSNYCVCPSPLMMAAHCAGVTSRIKLATGIVVLPLYSPARLIAEIGMVDALCDGRLVLGVGSGYQPFEFDRFNVDIGDAKERAKEMIDMIEEGLTQPVFSHSGAYYQMPRTHIAARGPQGLPEIWVAGDAPQMQQLAAEHGYKAIFTGRMSGVDYLLQQRRHCEKAFQAAGADTTHLPIGLLRFACVTDSKREAREFADNALFQNRLAANLRRRQEVMDDTGMMQEIPLDDEPSIDEIVDNLLIGDAETVAEKVVNEIRQVRPIHLASFFQVGRFPHDRAMRSIERFADEVMPAVEKELGSFAAA